MQVEEFTLFSVDDPYDLEFDCPVCWSRIYEYPFVISQIVGSVHNTSWGFEGIHVAFKDWLDSHVDDVVHSDIRESDYDTEVWDVRTPPRDEWLGRFDTLLSVSTMEEVRRASHVEIIERSFLPQLSPGGRLVITFDVPGFQVTEVEDALGVSMDLPDCPLSPHNSPRPWGRMSGDYRVGRLVITA